MWRGKECINLLAPKAPTSPGVRVLLSAEIGTMAAERHTGKENRWFGGAHQLGLVAAGLYQDPLKEGADIITGSAGKIFSGPQSGIILWDDPSIAKVVTDAVFPVWAATHQVNRVAALSLSVAEMLEYGNAYMSQIVKNAQAPEKRFSRRGFPCWHLIRSSPGLIRSSPMCASLEEGFGVTSSLPKSSSCSFKRLACSMYARRCAILRVTARLSVFIVPSNRSVFPGKVFLI